MTSIMLILSCTSTGSASELVNAEEVRRPKAKVTAAYGALFHSSGPVRPSFILWEDGLLMSCWISLEFAAARPACRHALLDEHERGPLMRELLDCSEIPNEPVVQPEPGTYPVNSERYVSELYLAPWPAVREVADQENEIYVREWSEDGTPRDLCLHEVFESVVVDTGTACSPRSDPSLPCCADLRGVGRGRGSCQRGADAPARPLRLDPR